MAVQSNLKNMALVLTLTCLFCSAILGGAYALTKDPIDKAAEAKTAKAIGAVLPEFDATSYETVSVDGKDFNYYLAKKGSETVGYAVESSTSGFGGPLSLIVGITADGVVYNTSVLSHSETPGLGAKCTTDEKFMGQWNGLQLEKTKLEVQKPVKDGIDAITASTITSKAYTQAVANALAAFDTIAKQEVEND